MKMEPYYQYHERRWENFKFVYPVVSRRTGGLSVGINLNPDKICNFDCPYCQVDRTLPSKTKFEQKTAIEEFSIIEDWIRNGELFKLERFKGVPEASRNWLDIAFSGDGEPSVSTHLEPMLQWLATQASSRDLPQIVIITNSTGLQKESTKRALKTLEQLKGCVWAKLDAGTDSYLKIVSASSYSMEFVMDQILSLSPSLELKLQTCLMKIQGCPPAREEIEHYRKRVEYILKHRAISEVQIYTVARKPAESFITPLTLQEMKELTSELNDLPVKIKLYPGAAD